MFRVIVIFKHISHLFLVLLLNYDKWILGGSDPLKLDLWACDLWIIYISLPLLLPFFFFFFPLLHLPSLLPIVKDRRVVESFIFKSPHKKISDWGNISKNERNYCDPIESSSQSQWLKQKIVENHRYLSIASVSSRRGIWC